MPWDSDDDPYAETEYLEREQQKPQPESEAADEDEAESEPESDGVTSGSPTPEPVTSSLDDAIRTAPVKQIHSLLILICQKHEPARKLASNRLLAPMETGTGRNRKAFEKCKNCGKDYSVLTNEKGDCMYHPGGMEAYFDSDFWADHDEDCHGRIDDLIDEPDFEDGFQWTCYERLGGEDGCVRSRHKPDVPEPVMKKVRY